ncbi:MAG: serine hydrolase [Burkholderiales bacterium]|nr:serine hydrolase [Burkholderiales bacterium]
MTDRPLDEDDALDDFTPRRITLDGVEKVVHVAGHGPAVIVMTEMPGISPQVARFSRWVRDAGFSVYMPSLFGRDGAVPQIDEGIAVFRRACVSAEFRAFAANPSSPVTQWLRALARLAHAECGGPGVGAIGMCFTGNFALSMMLEPALLAPVLCQPSLPIDDPAGLGVAPDELATVRQRLERDDLTALAYRFDGDKHCRAQRFAAFSQALGPRFVARVLPDSAANRETPPFFDKVVASPHSVVTAHLIDQAGQPTLAARDEILAFFAQRLGGSAETARSQQRTAMRHPARTFSLALALLIAATPGARGADADTSWPTNGWPTSSPEAQGLSSAALAELVDFGATNGIDSLLVVRHGKLVLDAYYAPFKRGEKHLVNSVTKAVVGTLAGIAFKDGALGPLDQPVLASFADRKIANPSADKQAMTLASLLDMTSGLDWKEPLTPEPPETLLQMERSADWVGFVLDRPMAQAPGQAFNYDSGTWHLVSALLARKTGTDTLDYARQKLFAPLGIADVLWRRDPQGIPIGGYGLYLLPHDMAKIGYLYLQGGQWAGQQLLPPAWVDHAFHPSVDMRASSSTTYRYAHGWWSIPDKQALLAVGYLRQLIIVLPRSDTVAAVTSRRFYSMPGLVDRIGATIRSDSALPADAAGSARLAARIADAAIDQPTPIGQVPPLAGAISGRTYRFGPNGLGLQSLQLDLAASPARYQVVYAARAPGQPARHTEGPLGLDGRFALSEPASDPLLAVKGSWLSDTVFEITARSVREGIVTTYTLGFDGNGVALSWEDNRGVRAQLRGEATP